MPRIGAGCGICERSGPISSSPLDRPDNACVTCWKAPGRRPTRIAAMGYDAFAAAVRDELPYCGATRRDLRILRANWTAAFEPGGVATERAAACERAAFSG